MNAYILFPNELPFDKELGYKIGCEVVRSSSPNAEPNANMIQGMALQTALVQHQQLHTTVLQTDESFENQWWDIYLPEFKTPMRIDVKSRSAEAKSYTLSAREHATQFTGSELFVWPLYKVQDSIFVLEFVIARLKGTDLIPPARTPTRFVDQAYKIPGFYWPIQELYNHGTKALDQINELNLL